MKGIAPNLKELQIQQGWGVVITIIDYISNYISSGIIDYNNYSKATDNRP